MAKSTKTKFENRVRFNWGYHDAAQAVREGWAKPERNFGFGPSLQITCVDDVMKQHFDKEYATGWLYGHHDATRGVDTNSSQPAWENAVTLKLVTEGN